jgi:hypothetical protein
MSDTDYPALRTWFAAAPRRKGRVEPPQAWPTKLPPETMAAIVAELRALLAGTEEDAELEHAVLTTLECGYDPRRDEMPVRDWLESLVLYFEERIHDEVRRREREQPPAVRADRLRPSVAAEVERIGVEDLAERTAVAPAVLRAFLNGETPDTETLDTFDDYAFVPYPDLGGLMGAYFYQCWDCGPAPETWEQVVDRFISAELPGVVRGAAGDIGRLLEAADDDEVKRVLDDLGWPFSRERTFGMTDREWIGAVRERLARAA